MRETKQYLGDSVYVDTDGYHVVLFTDNGDGPRNEIFLDLSVLRGLIGYTEKVFELKISVE